MSVNEKMTAIADAIRDKTGGTEKLTLDDMPIAIAEIAGYNEGYNKGVAETEAKNAWVPYITNLNTAFYSVEFPANTELTINIPSFGGNLSEAFYNCKNLVGLKLSCDNFKPYANGIVGATYSAVLRSNKELKWFDFSGIKAKATTWYTAFTGCYALEEIIGVIDVHESVKKSAFDSAFSGCTNLKEIRFAKGCILYGLQLYDCSKLSDASIQSIIEGLADLTGATTQTLYLHKDVGNKLTQAQKDAAYAKNWTLTY